MEIGQSIVSTEEYIALKEAKKILDDGDKIAYEYIAMSGLSYTSRISYIGKDSALTIMENALSTERATVQSLRDELKAHKKPLTTTPPKPDTTLSSRIKFLFTGRPVYESGK